MAQKQKTSPTGLPVEAELIEPLLAAPGTPGVPEGTDNAVLEPIDEDDVINNEFAGHSPEEQAQLKAEREKALTAPAAPVDRMEQIAEALLKFVSMSEARELRAESIRQKSYAEILPDSPWNPEGKRDRVKLSRPTTLHMIAINPLTHSEEEIALFNQLKPGRYLDRKVEVRMTQDGAIDLSWPGAKNDARIDMYSRFPNLASLLKAVIAERNAKEERRRKGVFSDDDSLE